MISVFVLQLFNPVVQIYDLNTWPSSLRLISPAHLVTLFLISLVVAVTGCVLFPLGYLVPSLLCLLLSLLILGGLTILAVSIFLQRKGSRLTRLKIRV